MVRIDWAGEIALAKAYGQADRAHTVSNAPDTQFGIASGTKGLTALTIVSLIEDGTLTLDTPAHSLLGDDLPLVDSAVTVEQLLAHRSGIGDYLDEESGPGPNDYVLPLPVQELATTAAFLPLLDGKPAKFRPGERFCYCNSGYVLLALIAERACGIAFHELVEQRVCEPAGMRDTGFLRSDELPGRAAIGYLEAEGLRTNVFHLPVRGSGDGGIYSTAADIHSMWSAIFDGRIVSTEWVATMLRPLSHAASQARRYGLGFWLDQSGDGVMLEGSDAGVSFRSRSDPGTERHLHRDFEHDSRSVAAGPLARTASRVALIPARDEVDAALDPSREGRVVAVERTQHRCSDRGA